MMERPPRVTAVIVTYQSRETIGRALEALAEAHASGLAEVVVVDNASTDGTADFIAEAHPWVALIRSGVNLGFGRGCNRGFESVRTPYVLFLNPDAVIRQDAIDVLVRFLDGRAEAGIAGPAILENQSSLQAAGLMTTPLTLVKGAAGSPRPYPDRRVIHPGETPFQTSWVCGAAFLIRSDLFRALGGFDPRFFLYFEETDLCRRALSRGTEIWAVGEAIAEHVGGASAREQSGQAQANVHPEHFFRSRFYYLVKHFGWTRAVAAELVGRSLDRLRVVRDRVTRGGRAPTGELQSRPFLRFPAQQHDAA